MDNDYVLKQKEGGKSHLQDQKIWPVTWRECEHISVVLRERAKKLLHTVAIPTKFDAMGKRQQKEWKRSSVIKYFKVSSKHIQVNRRRGHPVCFPRLQSTTLPVSLGGRCGKATEPGQNDLSCLIRMVFSDLIQNKSWLSCPLHRGQTGRIMENIGCLIHLNVFADNREDWQRCNIVGIIDR